MSVAVAPRYPEASDVARGVSILDVLPPDVQVRRAGAAQWYARCPLHADKTASLSIRSGHGKWRFNCFGCGERGDVLDFVMKLHGLTLNEAKDRLRGGATFDLDVTTATKQHVPAWLLVCDGCSRREEVEDADVVYLGETRLSSWWVGHARAYCGDCVAARVNPTGSRRFIEAFVDAVDAARRAA